MSHNEFIKTRKERFAILHEANLVKDLLRTNFPTATFYVTSRRIRRKKRQAYSITVAGKEYDPKTIKKLLEANTIGIEVRDEGLRFSTFENKKGQLFDISTMNWSTTSVIEFIEVGNPNSELTKNSRR